MLSCSVNWESKMANNRSYILYMFAFGLFVPLVVIISSYVSILRVVKKVIASDTSAPGSFHLLMS
jgi:c-opsin